MGAVASAEIAPATGDGDSGAMDDAWDERAWADGTPFTLLHDDAFVAEKYQELRRLDDVNESADALEMTGVDELPVDELERMADAARIKLFAVRWDEGSRAEQSGEDERRRQPVNALVEMEGTALARESREWLAVERRRAKQCEIAWDYLAGLAKRIESRACAQKRDRRFKQSSSEPTAATTTVNATDNGNEATTASVSTTARTNPRTSSNRMLCLAGSSLFSVASFRMQLEMLMAFRVANADLFENSVLSLVETVLDFPPFALHDVGSNKNAASESASVMIAVLLEDVYAFSRSLFQREDLSVAHTNALLVLLLALGVSSGRSALLLEFIARLLRGNTEASLSTAVGGRALSDWIDEILERLESYRVRYELGTLTEDSLMKRVNIKTIKDDSEKATNSAGFKQPGSIATDGDYVYTWSLSDGLSKIGTGQNFTVAGRVYSRAPALQFLRCLREKRHFRCGVYGSGVDATARVQEILHNSSDDVWTKPLGQLLRSDEVESDDTGAQRLLILLEVGEQRSPEVLECQAALNSASSEILRDPATNVLFAFYGNFVVLQDAAIELLIDVASTEKDGVELDSTLVKQLLVKSGKGDADMTEDREVILAYSFEEDQSRLFLERFAVGETISEYEDHGNDVYLSSMVLCGGRIYLSLMYPTVGSRLHTGYSERHRPRSLLQISPVDLTLVGTVVLCADDDDTAVGLSRDVRVSRPLFSYLTEGKLLYEIEMSAERFRVRVFGGLCGTKSSVNPKFLKLFDVDVQQVQCATFVNCFLKILKRELRVGDLDFELPSFFTNGTFLCMVLPSLASGGGSERSLPGIRCDCLMFDCDAEGFDPVGVPATEQADLLATDARNIKSFERTLPSQSCCFDATNNVIWVANLAQATFSSYRNSGRRIPLPSEEDDDESTTTQTRLKEEALSAEDVALRVLSFLVTRSTDQTNASSVGSTIHPDPFSTDQDERNLESLIDLAECFALKRSRGSATDAILRSLRCSLSLIRHCSRNSTSSMTLSAEAQAKLSILLADIIRHDGVISIPKQNSSVKEMNLKVVSAALALSAETAHVTNGNLAAQLDHIVILLQRWRKRDLSPSDEIVATSLLRQLRKVIERASEANVPSLLDVVSRFEILWSELVAVDLENITHHSSSNRLSTDQCEDPIHCELIALVSFFIQLMFVRAPSGVELFKMTLKIFSIVHKGLISVVTTASTTLHSDFNLVDVIEKLLKMSIVHRIAPVVLMGVTLLLRRIHEISKAFESESSGVARNEERASTAKSDVASLHTGLGNWLKTEADSLQALFKSLSGLVSAMKTEAKTISVETVSRTTKTEIMESAHEYENSQDVIQELRMPGATQIVITFDPRSRTEFSYDYLTFYKDKAQTSFYGEQFYSGRDGEFNWPGVQGLDPLIINSDHCFVYFHTDASNTDWGYKFTAVGELFEKAQVIQRHWLSSLLQMALGVIDEAARLLIEGTQLVSISETEARNDKILHSELLRHGVTADNEQDAGVIRLLRDFVAPPPDSDAARVLSALERENGVSRLRMRSSAAFGTDTATMSTNPVNVAIRAASAAILHHNMWGMDAFALAKGMRSDVSEQLLRGWKNAQKMREWFHLGDAADAARSGLESPSSRSVRRLLRRQPSAFKGMSDDAMEVLSRNVIERAMFLLEMTPMSFSYVSGAKRRWSFIAKYGSALGMTQNNLVRSSSNSTLGKWYSLLDELQEATELRSLLNYRRSSSERRKSRRLKSVTEQVLEFIQSDFDVGELRELIQARNERAIYRARGLSLYANASSSCKSAWLQLTLAESCSMALRKLALDAAQAISRISVSSADSSAAFPTPRLHFGTVLCGCSNELRKEVNRAFGSCLNQFVQALADQQVLETEYVVVLVKAICIDYDVDDTYLLHESNILPQLLRLLASKASRVRRSAQVLLDVFLSRLTDASDENGSENGNEASTFQTQLFATVGLQLEGIASKLRDTGASTFTAAGSWRDREINLSRPSSGFTAPSADECDVKWNHSIMLWIFVSSALSSYSLKVGDAVRRGPAWSDEDSSDTPDNADQAGLVTAIVNPTTVRVKWSGQSDARDYVFDPKQGKLEVVLASESIGGVVFCKGTKSLVKDSGVTAPWSHFGLFMGDRRQLSYRVSCGAEKECVYDTNYELDCDEWAHVAIIQNEEVLKFYVNGLLVSQQVLDPFMVLRSSFTASESKIIESAIHPVAEPADQYWPVHIPGASKIRVTFDPLSEIDQTSGFVRFYKNARCNEVWGENSYTGRYHDPERNFPGALSNRHRGRRSVVAAMASQSSLEIPCDRFLVYFHHSGDSSSWGFRLLATPEFASAQSACVFKASLNSHPFFVGEPPARIMDLPAAKCWLYQPEVVNTPLEEEEIVEQMQASCPSAAPTDFPVERALHVVGLLQTCAETSFGRQMIATPENVGDLILLAFEEATPVDVRCASVVVLKQLCGRLSADFITQQFQRVYPTCGDAAGAVEFVFSKFSNALNAWTRCPQNLTNCLISEEDDDKIEEAHLPCPMELQSSSTETQALTTAYASLLRRLAVKDGWLDHVCSIIETSLFQWETLRKFEEEAHVPGGETLWRLAAGNITAALALLGGAYSGVGVGARVRCCASIDLRETIETGYLIRFRHFNGTRTARILFDCDPTHPVDVPVGDVAYSGDDSDQELAAFLQEVTPRLFSGTLERPLVALLSELKTDIPHDVATYKPKVSRKENVEVLESEHPYAGGEDVTYPLFVHGVQEIVIYFDEMSCTAGQNDYVSFMKRDDDKRALDHPESKNGKAHWGEERYFGDSFPGVKGAPPLRIPATSVDVCFHTESSSLPSTEWGFKLTAHAFEETKTFPPEVPPTFYTNAVNDIRARTVKALHSCVRALRPTPIFKSVSRSFGSLAPYLATLSNAIDDGRPTQWPARSQIFESKHPYSNSVRECMTVTFSGAAQLTVTFDRRSQTEATTDYLTFHKDQSLEDRWGEQQYSGSDANGNWPGVGERPPLVIPSGTFTLLWVTDASNVDWGWRFTVAVEYPTITPRSLRVDQLNKQAQDLWEIFYEGIGPQRTPFEEEYDGFERFNSFTDWEASQIQNDTGKFLLFGNLSNVRSSNAHTKHSGRSKFRVMSDDGLEIFDSPSADGAVLGRLESCDEFWVVQESKQWLRTWSNPAAVGETAISGWVTRRKDDKVFAVAVQHLLENEDVLVVGVDDHPTNLFKARYNLHLSDNNAEGEVLTMFVSQFNVEALKGQSTRYQSLAYDTHRALVIKHAREALALLISSADSDSLTGSLRVDDFGSPDNLLLLLTRVMEDKRSASDEVDDLHSGLQNILLASKAEESSCALIDRCVEILESSSVVLPSARGVMRVFDSAHPYPDDAEQYTQLSIPGARKIVIHFDPRSKTEERCDWVCFYKNGTDRSECFGESIYHGRNGSENWPGFGGRPPLVIDADNFEVYFHSDANQNDWGFRFHAVGVFEAEDEETKNVPPLDEAKLQDLVKIMQLSLSLLIIATDACLATPENMRTRLAASVFSPRLIQVLITSIQHHPQQVRMKALKLLQQMFKNAPFVHSLPSNMVENVQNVLRLKLRAQFLAEDRSETKSEYLQTLVECALFVDLVADSACFSQLDHDQIIFEETPVLLSESSKTGQFEWTTTLVPVSHDAALQFSFRSVSGPVKIMLALHRNPDHDASVLDQDILLQWDSSSGAIVPSDLCGSPTIHSSARLGSGDSVSVYVNLLKNVLVLRKNSLCVFSLSNANLSSVQSQASFAVSLVASSENDVLTAKNLSGSPLIAVPVTITPNWYNRVCDAMSLLLDFDERRISSVVECESKHPLKTVRKDDMPNPEPERVCIKGACALEVRFDRRTVLDHHHRLRLTAPSADADTKVEAALVGICGSKCDESYPALFLNDSIKRTGTLKPNDRVVRSSVWAYGDEDGGLGCIGIVEEIVPWNGRNGCGVRVRWGDQREADKPTGDNIGVYRYGYDGFFDVQLCRQPKAWDTPLVIPGDTLEYSLDYILDEAIEGGADHPAEHDDFFQGTLCIGERTSATTLSLDIRKTKLLLGEECTVEFWVLVREGTFSNASMLLEDHTTVLALIEVTTLDPAHGLVIGAAQNGKLCVCSKTDHGLVELLCDGPVESVNACINDNQWIHLGIVFSAARVSLYADGKRILDGLIEQSLSLRNLYLATLRFGGQVEPRSDEPSIALLPIGSHVCDVRVWDVALRSEQLESHASRISGACPQDSQSWQSPKVPQAPKKQSRTSHFSQWLPPPSPQRSPRSPSRGSNAASHQRKWITSNRTGRELLTLRADCRIPSRVITSDGTSDKPVTIFYEAHILSSGKVCVGFASGDAKPLARDSILGSYGNAVGFELPQRRVRFGGSEPYESEDVVETVRSPRRRGSSAGGALFGDVFAREGDVVGCAFTPASKEFSFYVNGEPVAQVALEDDTIVPAPDVAESPRRTQCEFDTLVDEMLSMGFSRQASQDALDATPSTEVPTVPRAVDWLLGETTAQGGASVSSPRRLSAGSPFMSPRGRMSSASTSGASSRRAFMAPLAAGQACYVPAATLGAQGAQGIAWNFGHRAFKYPPSSDAAVVSAMQAANPNGSEGDTICFEVFDHGENKWERVSHRHRIQETEPVLLARWKLDEGSGTTVYDSTDLDQIGTIQLSNEKAAPESGPLSPRSRKTLLFWDADCVPPHAVIHNSGAPMFAVFQGMEAPDGSVSGVKAPIVWGYRFFVIPHFSPESIGRRRFQTQAHRFIMDGPKMELRHDQQLIKYVNKAATSKQIGLSQILRASWPDLAPPESDLVKWPVLVEIATGISTSPSAEETTPTGTTMAGSVKAVALDRLGKQFKLLQELNGVVSRLLPFVAFTEPSPGTPRGRMRLDQLIRDQRHRIFHAVKQSVWDASLRHSQAEGTTFELTLNRPKAMRHRVAGKVDTEGRFALFSQAFQQLNILPNKHFRRAAPIYKVQLLGENAQDAGGPYRETLAQYADELHSTQLPLLTASSNAQHNVGAAREKWVLHPGSTNGTQIQMLEFLGKLMGVAMRSQEYLALQLALLIWKKLANEPVTTDDLALVDSMIVSSMQKIRSIDQYGVTAEMFEDIVMETFTTLSTDNRVVPLKPHGASVAVTFESRVEFADLVDQYRLHEFDVQIAALLRGLAKVVPPHLLSLYTGAELEQLVCGSPEVDVDLLQRCTEYSSCNANDDHIVWFWQVLREFSHEERSVFLRFVWGRSRLPPSDKEFPQRFKLQSFSKTISASSLNGADAYLPIAHTCFFSVELPRYSSAHVLKEKLTYAMYNCQEIDGDGDSVAANQLGWEV